MLRALPFAIVLACLVSLPVSAQCPANTAGCDAVPFVQHFSANALPTIDFDTGYVPGGSPLQIRAALHIAGTTQVHLDATQTVYYPPPIRVAYPPSPTGYLLIDYGITLGVWIRFDLLGITWEGEIPIPGIPSDLAIQSRLALDDLVLTGATPRPATVSDATSRIRVLAYDLLSFLSAIGGGGGVAIDAQAAITAAYDSTRIVTNRAGLITAEGATGSIYPTVGNDYGAFVDLAAHTEGSLTHTGTVHLYPSVYLTLLGQGFTLDLADIPFDLVRTTRAVVFPTVSRRVPLPDLGLDALRVEYPNTLLGTASGFELRVRNDGAAPMTVTVDLAGSPSFALTGPYVGTGNFTVNPGTSVDLAPVFRPTAIGAVAASLTIRTNDPDTPLRVVTLAGTGTDRPVLPDGGIADAGADAALGDGGVEPPPLAVGGCSCEVADTRDDAVARLAIGFALVGIGLRFVRRRR